MFDYLFDFLNKLPFGYKDKLIKFSFVNLIYSFRSFINHDLLSTVE